MKRIFTLFAALLFTASLWAQSPEKMSYQAVIRDGNNKLVTNQKVGMQISILQGSATGTAVYVEAQTPTTNADGLVSIEIGNGTVESGNLVTIDWANGPYFLKTETDPTGGTSYTITGTSQLLSVPYALDAKTAEALSNESNLATTTALSDSAAQICSEIQDTASQIRADIPDVSGLATKTALGDSTALVRSEIPDVSGIAENKQAIQDTASQIRAAIPDVSGLATKTALGDSTALVRSEIPDVSGIAENKQAIQDTASQIRAAIPDVSGLATETALGDSTARVRSEIPDVSGIAENKQAIQDTASQIRADIPDVSGLANAKTFNLDNAYDNGDTITADSGAVFINGTDGLISTGTYGSGAALSVSGPGARMMWYPKKAAFRVGNVNGIDWNDDSIGSNSIAMGYNTTASGGTSIALGNETRASGSLAPVAMGYQTKSYGQSTTTMGYETKASGDRSIAMDDHTVASGFAATAMGSNTNAIGNYSTAMGDSTTAQAFSSVVLGRWNVITGSESGWYGTDPLFVVGNGTSSVPSNALTVLKNGNTGIGTATPDTTLEVAGLIKITGGSPGAGKVLTSDANGLATWAAPGTSTFNLDDAYDNGDTITADSGAVVINGTDGLISTGTYGSGAALSVSGAGTRMIWYPAKAAFRAGYVNGSEWDNSAVGDYSIAMGYSTQASGKGSTALGYNTIADMVYSTAMGAGTKAGGGESTAMGYGTTASGTASTAMGAYSAASGDYSTAMGEQDTARGQASTAMGFFTAASGDYSTAMGHNTTASNSVSVAMGDHTTASGNTSTAMGYGTKASGGYSTTMGNSTAASGQASTAMGVFTTAQAYGSLVLGQYNVISDTYLPNSWVPTDPLFVVGNGTSSTATSNALTVLKNGNTGIGTATPDTTLEVAGLIKITGGSPGAGKVLTSDANGLATWASGTSTFNLDDAYDNGDTITADSGAVFINGTDGLISTGTYGSGAALSVSGAGTRMIWYPAKAAFRAGYVNGTQWDDANIGAYSTAMGYSTQASGKGSTALGYNTIADTDYSVAVGAGTKASGVGSTALGYGTIASGNYSTAMGYDTKASEVNSTAMGVYTTATGAYSTAMGIYTTAQAYGSFVIGQFNVIAGDFSNPDPTNPLFVVGDGRSNLAPSNALTVLENGNTGIGTATPDTTLEVAGLIKITGGSPGAGKVLTSDANGLATWEAPGTSTFNLDNAYDNGDTITADSGAVVINGTDGLISTGTYGSGTALTVSGAGTRMIWYPAKAAFRAGYVDGTQWDDSVVGNYSTAMGASTKASGNSSAAMGYNTKASGSASMAMGDQTVASGDYSMAMGLQDTASGHASTAMGKSTTASSDVSTAMGYQTAASGGISTAMGQHTTASGGVSTTMGYTTTASGDESTSMGYGTTAQAFASLALGRYNIVTGTKSSWTGSDPVLVVGNGSSGTSRSNAFTLLQDGSLTITGALTQSSDIRLKKDIIPLGDVLPEIEKITPISYRFKNTKTHPAGKQIGFSAQNIQKEFPELVSKDSKGYLSVAYQNMTAILLQAVKEQQKTIADLTNRVSKQNNKIAMLQKTEAENTTLKNKVASLENALSEQNSKIASQQKFIEKMAGNMTAIVSKLKTLENNKSELSYNEKAH